MYEWYDIVMISLLSYNYHITVLIELWYQCSLTGDISLSSYSCNITGFIYLWYNWPHRVLISLSCSCDIIALINLWYHRVVIALSSYKRNITVILMGTLREPFEVWGPRGHGITFGVFLGTFHVLLVVNYWSAETTYLRK